MPSGSFNISAVLGSLRSFTKMSGDLNGFLKSGIAPESNIITWDHRLAPAKLAALFTRPLSIGTFNQLAQKTITSPPCLLITRLLQLGLCKLYCNEFFNLELSLVFLTHKFGFFMSRIVMNPFCNVNKTELKVFKIKYYGTIDYLLNQQKNIGLTIPDWFWHTLIAILGQTAIDNDKEYYH